MPKKKTPQKLNTDESDLAVNDVLDVNEEEKEIVVKAVPAKTKKQTRGRSKKTVSMTSENDENSEWKNEDSIDSENSNDEDEDLVEDPIEILEAAVTGDLSEDPVRLYLKEIGRIDLLDADSEFRLAARIEADRLLDHVIINSQIETKTPGYYTAIYSTVVDLLYESWKQFLGDVDTFNQSEAPDIDLFC